MKFKKIIKINSMPNWFEIESICIQKGTLITWQYHTTRSLISSWLNQVIPGERKEVLSESMVSTFFLTSLIFSKFYLELAFLSLILPFHNLPLVSILFSNNSSSTLSLHLSFGLSPLSFPLYDQIGQFLYLWKVHFVKRKFSNII